MASSLPANHVTAHWRVTWVGFDIALTATFAGAAIAARRGAPAFRGFLVAASVLLVCDAWFDITTAATIHQLVSAVTEAGVAEVPTAVVCLTAARKPIAPS
jgi:hypothetical protein